MCFSVLDKAHSSQFPKTESSRTLMISRRLYLFLPPIYGLLVCRRGRVVHYVLNKYCCCGNKIAARERVGSGTFSELVVANKKPFRIVGVLMRTHSLASCRVAKVAATVTKHSKSEISQPSRRRMTFDQVEGIRFLFCS